MGDLIHLVYCSRAVRPLGRADLADLLTLARRKNEACGITGMLLYAQGAFFQVLEGAPLDVERLFQRITRDPRHTHVVRIIREPIAERSFGDWTMGYADLAPGHVTAIEGLNDFLQQDDGRAELGDGRAIKLLEAFRKGRWRSTLSDRAPIIPSIPPAPATVFPAFSHAYQPIMQTSPESVFAYEALIRGPRGESVASVLSQVDPAIRHIFHEHARISAIQTAVRLKLSVRLNLNFPPSHVQLSPTAVSSVLTAAGANGLDPGRITLEILESEIIENPSGLAAIMNEYRDSGLTFAIDDFGSGYAGLNLLADFQPEYVKLDRNLVREVDRDGPRQAILRGIAGTCQDLGIVIVAEGIERAEEFLWLRDEGIRLFQGYLLARPSFEALPTSLTGLCALTRPATA